MKLIKPSFEIWEQKPRNIIIPADMEIGPKMARQELIDTIYRQIERAGRICYKSEDKITEDSSKPFVDRLIKSGHTSVLEHGTVYLYVNDYKKEYLYTRNKYVQNPYSRVTDVTYSDGRLMDSFISTNMRVLIENDWLDDLKYICEPTAHHEKRVTAYFITDAGVMREFFRHRVFSMAQESTRYCNYLRDKFGNSITIIYPCWLKEEEELEFEEDMRVIEELYFKWLKKGWTAQQARVFLPLGVKAEAIMTGFVSDWKHFFFLRCPVNAHPQARELAIPLREEFIKRGYK